MTLTPPPLSNLGQLHQSLGQVDPTVQYFERHVALTTGVEYHEGMIYGLRNLAHVFQAIGRFEDATACYTKLLALAEELGHADLYAKVLSGMASVEKKMAAGVKISPRDAAMALMVAAEEAPHQPLSKRTMRGTLGKALRRKQKQRAVSDMYGNVRVQGYARVVVMADRVCCRAAAFITRRMSVESSKPWSCSSWLLIWKDVCLSLSVRY